MNNERSVKLVTVVAAVCSLVAPMVLAVDPSPDGGYPNQNTAEGDDALFSLTTGSANTAIGYVALYANTTGSFNTAVGEDALLNNVVGNHNTAVGGYALGPNLASDNTGIGIEVLADNATGPGNTATGELTLGYASSTSYGTAFGQEAGGAGNFSVAIGSFAGSEGDSNTASGYFAMRNGDGQDNTATGVYALDGYLSAIYNTANGNYSLTADTGGAQNSAVGYRALAYNELGNSNTALGAFALYRNKNGLNNSAIGFDSLYNNTNGNYNIGLGDSSGMNLTTGSNNIDVGNTGVVAESNTIRVGTTDTQTACYIAAVYGGAAGSTSLKVDAAGHVGTVLSSARFKDNIRPMDKLSEVIRSLKPVTFRYKHALDPTGAPQFGLVAEEVEKVAPELVAYDKEGKPYSVRYDGVNIMLLNEFLKDHCKVEQLEAAIAEQRSTFQAALAALSARRVKQAAHMEQVSARLATTQPNPHLVTNE